MTKKIDQEVAAGRDPSAWQPAAGVTVNLYLVRDAMDDARRPALDDADKKQANCMGGAVPNWVGDAQMAWDIGVTIAILPFILLFKSYKEFHVDLTEIYKGTPLGGENALLPKARDDVLRELGIGGDVAKVLKDPVNTIRDAVGGALGDLGEGIGGLIGGLFGGWKPKPVLI